MEELKPIEENEMATKLTKGKWTTIRIRKATAIRLKENTTMTYDQTINTYINRNTTRAMMTEHRTEILKKIREEVESALFNFKN